MILFQAVAYKKMRANFARESKCTIFKKLFWWIFHFCRCPLSIPYRHGFEWYLSFCLSFQIVLGGVYRMISTMRILPIENRFSKSKVPLLWLIRVLIIYNCLIYNYTSNGQFSIWITIWIRNYYSMTNGVCINYLSVCFI